MLNKLETLKPGQYAILFRSNWNADPDVFHTLAELDTDGRWLSTETGKELFEYDGDKIMKAWRLDDSSDLLLKVAEPTNDVSELKHPDERAAFNAWNNDVDCPLAGLDAKAAAWKAWGFRAIGHSPVSLAIADILTERRRQISGEGWTPVHDDEHVDGQIAEAAAAYAYYAHEPSYDIAPSMWPWGATAWKHTEPRRNLVKAGALIIAELERIDRATAV